MSEVPTAVAPAKLSSGTKPRLSLLSAKQQAVGRDKSEDQPDHQPHVTVISELHQTTNLDEVADTRIESVKQEYNKQPDSDRLLTNGDAQQRNDGEDDDDGKLVNTGNTNNVSGNKMNISKEDLIRLLSLLKSELQSKEIALAAIKCEQLKRLLNPVEISRSSLANTYIELQNRLEPRDLNNNDSRQKTDRPESASNNKNSQTIPVSNEVKLNEANIKQQTKDQKQDGEENSRESLNILNTLLELLDRHPLLALPRDSIYCLDYNCNEVSTKNYLNLKIQHLDNLINQHRRYRYHMNERLKKSEQRYLDLARELEYERNAKFCEESVYGNSGRSILLKHIDQLKENIEKEKRDKEAIVMTLLNELLDERERNESLTKKLVELEKTGIQNAGEKEKMLMLEKEMDSITMQLKKQSMVYAKDRNEMQSKLASLELENSSLKSKLEQQEKRLATLLQTKSPQSSAASSNQTTPPAGSKANEVTATGRVPTKAFSPATVNTKQLPNVAPRNSISGSVLASKSSPPAKIQSTNSYTSNGSVAQQRTMASRTANYSFQGDNDITTLASPIQQHQDSPRQTVLSQRSTSTTTPTTIDSKSLSGGSQTISSGTGPAKVQPLFKSASVSSSTNHHARNIKTSVSSVGSNPIPAATPSRSSSGGQLLIKPQVPAKPAQLLDQQRKPFN